VDDIPPAPHQLNYGSQPPSFKRWLRLFSVCVVVLAIGWAGWFASESIRRWYVRRQYQRMADKWYVLAANHVDTPPVLKYTDDPIDAPAGGFTSLVGGLGFRKNQDPTVDRIPMFNGNGDPILTSDWRIVFTQERTNSIGLKRLLIVDMTSWMGNNIDLQVYQVARSSRQMPGMIGLENGRGTRVNMTGFATPGSLRLFSGQADRTDPAKFYIPFESHGRRGRIYGTFVAGLSFSKDPKMASLESEINSTVKWTIAWD
jgi:hypothetical protein